MKYYHGSSIPNLQVLQPMVDKRTGVRGVFVSYEPYGPSMFSLLPCRYRAVINYSTDIKGGEYRFLSGSVVTDLPLNPKGYLYEVVSTELPLRYLEEDYYFPMAIECQLVKEVLREELIELGWSVEVRV